MKLKVVVDANWGCSSGFIQYYRVEECLARVLAVAFVEYFLVDSHSS